MDEPKKQAHSFPGDVGGDLDRLLTLIETAHEHGDETAIVEQAAKVRAALTPSAPEPVQKLHELPRDVGARAIELLREYMDAEEIDDVDARAAELGACRFSVRAFLETVPSALPEKAVKPVAYLHKNTETGDVGLELYRHGAGALTDADRAVGWIETELYALPSHQGAGEP